MGTSNIFFLHNQQIPRLQPWVLAALLMALFVPNNAIVIRKSSESPSSSTVTSFTTSGPESSMSGPKPLESSTKSSSNTTLPTSIPPTPKSRLNRADDLAESSSSQSSATINAPVGHSTSALQHEQYRQFLQNQAAAHSRHSGQQASNNVAPNDHSSATTQPQALQSQAMTAAGGSPVNLPLEQQQIALARAKPGQFTLVSNQQVGPGHVTMIGYTTPIVKVGGIVKIDQISPGQMGAAAHRNSESTSLHHSSASLTPNSQASATSSMYSSPVSGLSHHHHSQMVKHQVECYS